jgi:hypothetical protein
MAKRRLAVLFLAISIAITLPGLAFAATGNVSAGSGLVPCGVSSGDQSTECQACNLVELLQNVIMFLIGLSIPLAVAMFAWAGILYFTSGAGGTENISKAKKIFGSTLFGFGLAVSGWLIINTILFTILDKNQYPDSSWFNISCVSGRPTQTTISQVLENSLGSAPTPTAQVFNQDYVTACPTGYTLTSENKCTDYIKDITIDPVYKVNGTTISAATLSEARLLAQLAGTKQYTAALQAACNKEGLSNCKLAQAVMAIESGGNKGAGSGAGALGLMQLMPGTARSLDPSLAGLSDAALRERLLTDTDLNMTLGVKYLNQLESQFVNIQDVVAAYNGGPKANTPSVTCADLQQTYWECTANGGYLETRKYVPNVLAAMSFL